jgi:hypothetical protein
MPGTVQAGRAGVAQAGHAGTMPLGRKRMAFVLFFYFLNIFKSLQIQNFVYDSFELRKL